MMWESTPQGEAPMPARRATSGSPSCFVRGATAHSPHPKRHQEQSTAAQDSKEPMNHVRLTRTIAQSAELPVEIQMAGYTLESEPTPGIAFVQPSMVGGDRAREFEALDS
eukprot:3038499-Amphidinium_carterae.1